MAQSGREHDQGIIFPRAKFFTVAASVASRFKGQSFQLASFLIDLTACQSVSKVRVQVLVQVLTSFSVFHTLNELGILMKFHNLSSCVVS